MGFPVLKSASYALIHANDMVVHQGSTQTSERRLNPDSEYLKELPKHFRTFEQAAAYPPNQVFIGNLEPKALDTIARPWYENSVKGAAAEVRKGKHGEIMPLDEFIGLVKSVDAFDLVLLEESFAARAYEILKAHPVVSAWPFLEKLTKSPADEAAIKDSVENQGSEPLYFEEKLVGCVKKAHAFDEALSSHVMFENLVSKASAAFALGLLFAKTGLEPTSVDYIIECSEEACGDMNQRGGGNFAKSIGEVCGCVNATGSDTRGFCAAPVHALVKAAALVKAGVYKNVIVVAGGASTKLGMNGKDHVKKGMPILEDVIGAFAAHISENDGVSPIIRTDIVGRHTVGSGASPQAVTQAIVADPLDRVGLKIGDVDVFSVEMQNPEVTEPAGAGDVPKANYKMIAALGVMRKEFERSELNNVVEKIAMPGFAPTQGHIPSGVPFLAHCKDFMDADKLNRVMIIGKGSLFLGRLTNLFDGVSFILEKNSGIMPILNADGEALGAFMSDAGMPAKRTRVALTLLGSEHGVAEMLHGAEMAQAANDHIEVVVIGPKYEISGGEEHHRQVAANQIEANDEKSAHERMDAMLKSGQVDAAVTMHYNFPIGVSTVGRVVTPGMGRKMLIANTTGTSDTRRTAALLKNTLQGVAVAKACGNPRPTVGILNIDGARALERMLEALRENGYELNFTESARADGGAVMRGNDLLQGVPDVMVMDSLTGNVMMKTLSAFTTGGSYESVGDGYGPGVGEGYDRIIHILSRASGAPVVAGAISFAAACAKGKLVEKVNTEFAAARKAGLDDVLKKFSEGSSGGSAKGVSGSDGVSASGAGEASGDGIPTPPPEKVVTCEIPGIEILDLDDAVHVLWKNGIFASSGMGCTGPIVLVAPEDEESARRLLKESGHL
ncbi:MAG: glycine/sarcosine/betaine reductase complex component C subunit beta [Defluviitaleaceae bacterium]|nr:glycine/sarcosine/betaine reductase complex component C subunit beta [Defluviitaleaceae bacterium]